MERQRPTPPEADIPTPLEVQFGTIPERLQEHPQWVVWRYEVLQSADGEREIKKPPFSPRTGKRASVSRPETWGSFRDAQRAYETGNYAGVGIVLTPALGIVGIDIDHCIDEEQISDEAQQLITAIDSYTELSPSGAGIRMLAEAKLPGAFRRKGTIEMYEDMRYLTITGHSLPHTPPEIRQRNRELYTVYQRLFPQERRKENTGGGDAPQADRQYRRSLSDEQVLQKATHAHNAATFKRYYAGDYSLWEGAGAKHRSRSEADFTLVLLLLYWTNNDTVQVDRLFRHSGLMRSKWNRPVKGQETYGERIVSDALKKGSQ
ncbi:MAG TPA: hypothetical protein VNG51_21965 [Ktedonobacteraceae bacterium]|nr:hypothetical protein [Ktedonobacteraceae bacterium]